MAHFYAVWMFFNEYALLLKSEISKQCEVDLEVKIELLVLLERCF